MIMTSISKPIVFFGTEDFSLTALTGLIEAGYFIAAVVTKPDSKKGRGQKLTPSSVKIAATRHNIPVWQPEKLADITAKIKAIDKPLGVLVSYGKIIPASIIELFPLGIINLHPSLLPLYRGPSPIESAILNGDQKTGVSIMRIVPEMDAGPVFAAKEHLLNHSETQIELYSSLATLGTNLLLETLPGILNNRLTPTTQDDAKATYCPLLKKQDAWLDPSKCTAIEAERRIRAYLDYPKTKLKLKDFAVIITKAHVSQDKKTPLDIVCRNDTILSIDELIAPSGRRINADDFLRGYRL